MADHEELDRNAPHFLHLISAFLSMEPPEMLISLARVCGGGSITESIQTFIWENCLNIADNKLSSPYMKGFLKKLIIELESEGGDVLDELYEQYANYMTSSKDDDSRRGNFSVLKRISFIFPDEHPDVPVCPKSRQLVVHLQCSLNMLEGDTGCSIWPASLFLSEFILCNPEIFSTKSCLEVGSGVGLVGICLAKVKAAKVTLSDGNLSSLANLKVNLKLNQLSVDTASDVVPSDTDVEFQVQCVHLPWESALESELQNFTPDIVLGADVIYNPSCLPHLIRVFAALLSRRKPFCYNPEFSSDPFLGSKCTSREAHCPGCSQSIGQGKSHSRVMRRCSDTRDDEDGQGSKTSHGTNDALQSKFRCCALQEGPVAYIASVIRNTETFNYFLKLAEQANLIVMDLTEDIKLFDLLPYMQTYQRSTIRLFSVQCPST